MRKLGTKKVLNPLTKNARDRLYRNLISMIQKYSYLSIDEKVFVLSMCYHKIVEGEV